MVTDRKMKIIDVSQCSKNLDFRPLIQWPTNLPRYSWHGELLCGFDAESGEVIEMSDWIKLSDSTCPPTDAPTDIDQAKALDLFVSCHPKLGFIELARLKKCLESRPLFSLSDLLEKYRFRLSEDLVATMDCLAQLPLSLQSLFAEKDLSPKDLAPLRLLFRDGRNSEIENISLLWNRLENELLSRQYLVRALDLAIELLESGTPLLDIVESTKTSDAWIRQLEDWRYPMTTAKDRASQNALKAINWPRETKASWIRTGDKGSLEIRLTANSVTDLGFKIESLKSIVKANDALEAIWKSP